MNIRAYVRRLFHSQISLLAPMLLITLAWSITAFPVPGGPGSQLLNGGMNIGIYPFGFCQRLPAEIQYQCEVLGARINAAGKEKTVYEGEFIEANAKSRKVRVTVQLRGLVKLEGFKHQDSVLSFNGEKRTEASSRSDEALLETFLMDTQEALLEAATTTTAPYRLLGRDFGPDPRIEPNYKGPRYDIYTITMPFAFKKTESMRVKRFYFDTKTGLLNKTEYLDQSISPAPRVETRFSEWKTIEGSAYPSKIEHYEDGKLIFTFVAERIEGGPAIAASNY
jgi:hypothetical protein